MTYTPIPTVLAPLPDSISDGVLRRLLGRLLAEPWISLHVEGIEEGRESLLASSLVSHDRFEEQAVRSREIRDAQGDLHLGTESFDVEVSAREVLDLLDDLFVRVSLVRNAIDAVRLAQTCRMLVRLLANDGSPIPFTSEIQGRLYRLLRHAARNAAAISERHAPVERHTIDLLHRDALKVTRAISSVLVESDEDADGNESRFIRDEIEALLLDPSAHALLDEQQRDSIERLPERADEVLEAAGPEIERLLGAIVSHNSFGRLQAVSGAAASLDEPTVARLTGIVRLLDRLDRIAAEARVSTEERDPILAMLADSSVGVLRRTARFAEQNASVLRDRIATQGGIDSSEITRTMRRLVEGEGLDVVTETF